MIIDSHVHYNNRAFRKPFRYLSYGPDGYALKEGELPQLMDELENAGIRYLIEPGVSLESCKEILDLAAQYPDRIFPAIGVHPTRSVCLPEDAMETLAVYAQTPGVIAIGEIGLDYHLSEEEQPRPEQQKWFSHQLDLARALKLPVILHVRDAHEDALAILSLHPAGKQGGVIHCFCGSWALAERYLELGYHIGIGGSLLQTEERAKDLREAVERIPLDRILVETDAPFILPCCKDVIQPKLLRRARNTSLILPAVIGKIAGLKGICPSVVEQAVLENTVQLFRLPVDIQKK